MEVELLILNKKLPTGRFYTKDSFGIIPEMVYCTTEVKIYKEIAYPNLDLAGVIGKITNIKVNETNVTGEVEFMKTGLAPLIKELPLKYISVGVCSNLSSTGEVGNFMLTHVVVKSG